MTRWVRLSGVAAIVGGALWAAGAVNHATKPRGCVAAECAVRPMRESGTLEGLLAIVAALLIMAGVAGLVLLSRSAGRWTRTGSIGVHVGVVGLVVLLAAGVAQAALFDGSFSLMPYFVLPGMVALVLGFLLVGVAILRARVLPRWLGVLLILASLTMLGSNEQTATVLLLIPFGLAWMAAGYVLWSRGTGLVDRRPRPSTGSTGIPV
jgi:hypothetical protein